MWGALHAALFIPNYLLQKTGKIEYSEKSRIKDLPQVLVTFSVVCIAWVFFRANSVGQAWDIVAEIFSDSLFTMPAVRPYFVFLLIGIMTSLEWMGRSEQFPLKNSFNRLPKLARWLAYSVLILMTVYFSGGQQSFIYFQF